MLILGLETSCDETAAAIISVENEVKVLSEEISSQVETHQAYGGVVPELASREHLRNLPLVVDQVFKSSSVTIENIDRIAVTVGPGLKGCLLIGAEFAKGLALASNKKLLAVNHIEGHLLAPMLDNPELKPPYLALIVSGGHTEIVHVQEVGKYEILTRTTDDAAGEAFDKSAALLNFAYPGGPKLAAMADTVQQSEFTLPKVAREMQGFSFSGLKTAIALLVKREKSRLEAPQVKAQLCHAIQASIVETLMHKLHIALKETGVRHVAVSGGVAANSALRRAVSKLSSAKSYFPKPLHSTDNGAMIAYAAYRREMSRCPELTLEVRSRWPVETI